MCFAYLSPLDLGNVFYEAGGPSRNPLVVGQVVEGALHLRMVFHIRFQLIEGESALLKDLLELLPGFGLCLSEGHLHT